MEPKEEQSNTGNFTSLNLEAIRRAGVYCNVLAATSGNRPDFKCYSSPTTSRAYGDTSHASKRKFFKAVKKLTEKPKDPEKALLTKKDNYYIALPYNKEKPFAQIPNNLISLPQDTLRFYACLSWAYKTGKKVNEYILYKMVGLQFYKETEFISKKGKKIIKKEKTLQSLIDMFKATEAIPNRLELLEVLDPNTPNRFDKEKKSKPAKKVAAKKDQKVVSKGETVCVPPPTAVTPQEEPETILNQTAMSVDYSYDTLLAGMPDFIKERHLARQTPGSLTGTKYDSMTEAELNAEVEALREARFLSHGTVDGITLSAPLEINLWKFAKARKIEAKQAELSNKDSKPFVLEDFAQERTYSVSDKNRDAMLGLLD